MRVELQVLGCGTVDMPPSLMIATENERYLFNCGEGLQRFCMEHHVRLAKVSWVMLAQLNSASLGGLPGMLLTVSDFGKTELNIVGPPGLGQLFQEARTFLARPKLNMHLYQTSPAGPAEHTLGGNQLQITPVALVAATATPAETGGATGGATDTKMEPVEAAALPPWATPMTMHWSGPAPAADAAVVDPHHVVACYICRTPEVPGKFYPDRAVALGVKKGPLFGQLSRGQSVTLPDGTVVHPHQCQDPATPGQVVLVVSCPSSAFLQPLLNSPAIRKCHRAAEVCAVVHMTPRSILASPDYQSWMSCFAGTTKHIHLHKDVSPVKSSFCAQAAMLCKLNAIYSEGFAVPFPLTACAFPTPEEVAAVAALTAVGVGTNGTPAVTVSNSKTEEDWISSRPSIMSNTGKGRIRVGADFQAALPEPEAAKLAPVSVVTADHGLKFIVAPHKSVGFDHSSVVPQLDSFSAVSDMASNEELRKVYAEFVARLETLEPESSFPDEFGITFLGTGSAIPSKYRNVTGIFARLSHDHAMLLDCGEGTVGQLFRWLRTYNAFVEALTAINVVISLVDLSVVQSGLKEPLVVIGPAPLEAWVNAYCNCIPKLIGSVKFVDVAACVVGLSGADPLAGHYGVLGCKEIKTTPVIHCPLAFAARITLMTGETVVYSGDTIPCDALAELGHECTMLIHEATLQDDMEKEAADKQHSTMGQAIAMAHRMHAKHLVMTHFSARYQKLPALDGRESLVAAFDLMTVNKRTLPALRCLWPVLGILFAEEEDASSVADTA